MYMCVCVFVHILTRYHNREFESLYVIASYKKIDLWVRLFRLWWSYTVSFAEKHFTVHEVIVQWTQPCVSANWVAFWATHMIPFKRTTKSSAIVTLFQRSSWTSSQIIHRDHFSSIRQYILNQNKCHLSLIVMCLIVWIGGTDKSVDYKKIVVIVNRPEIKYKKNSRFVI